MEQRVQVIDDYRQFEFTLNRELGQCAVDEKLVLTSLKHAQQQSAALQLQQQQQQVTAAALNNTSAAAGAAAGADNTKTAADGTVITTSSTTTAPAPVPPRSTFTNIRGNECFTRIEKKKAALAHVKQNLLKSVGRIVVCRCCERILEIYTKSADPMVCAAASSRHDD